MKNRTANAAENCHYNPQLETRVKCDTSRAGPRAALEQLTVDRWKLIAFTSSFQKFFEERYSSFNEVELLCVVCSGSKIKTKVRCVDVSLKNQSVHALILAVSP